MSGDVAVLAADTVSQKSNAHVIFGKLNAPPCSLKSHYIILLLRLTQNHYSVTFIT